MASEAVLTAPQPDTIDRERAQLYVTDAQLIRRMGVPERQGRAMLQDLAKKPGFPRKQAYASGRRYWPAVKEYFDKLNGLKSTG